MTSIQSTHESGNAALHKPLVLLLAAGAGLSVATLYYSPPMLGILAANIGARMPSMGWL